MKSDKDKDKDRFKKEINVKINGAGFCGIRSEFVAHYFLRSHFFLTFDFSKPCDAIVRLRNAKITERKKFPFQAHPRS